jgi:hypothetical protein
MYAHNDSQIKNLFSSAEYVSHYEMGRLLAYLIGYDISDICYKENGYYVCGPNLHGYAGFLKLNYKDDKLEKIIFEK